MWPVMVTIPDFSDWVKYNFPTVPDPFASTSLTTRVMFFSVDSNNTTKKSNIVYLDVYIFTIERTLHTTPTIIYLELWFVPVLYYCIVRLHQNKFCIHYQSLAHLFLLRFPVPAYKDLCKSLALHFLRSRRMDFL